MSKLLNKIIICSIFAVAIICSHSAYADSYSGECGTSTVWNLNTDTGMLTLSGTGRVTSIPWNNYKKFITGIVISDDITTIPDSAFSYCINLKTARIGNNLASISKYAFSGCSALENVQLGEAVNKIDACAFDNCGMLTEIIIPDSVKIIDGGAFGYCASLEKVVLGKEIASIGNYAFSGCVKLDNVIIPAKTGIIGNYAFSGCKMLRNITLNEGVSLIGNSAFEYCSGLEAIYIPGSVSQIGEQTFNACTNLQKIIVKQDNKYYCSDDRGVLFTKDMKNLIQYPPASGNAIYIIPDTITYISDWAFYRAVNVRHIYMPTTVSRIGYASFYETDNLVSILYGGSKQEFDSIDKSDQNISLDKVNKIYNFLFTKGDVNLDGEITIIDVSSLRLYLLNNFSALGYDVVDINNDGILDETDVITLRRFIAGGYNIVLKNNQQEGVDKIK